MDETGEDVENRKWEYKKWDTFYLVCWFLGFLFALLANAIERLRFDRPDEPIFLINAYQIRNEHRVRLSPVCSQPHRYRANINIST